MILKFSFFQRLIVIEPLVRETIEKNGENYFLLKLSCFKTLAKLMFSEISVGDLFEERSFVPMFKGATKL